MRNKSLTLIFTVIIIAAMLLPGVPAARAGTTAAAPASAPELAGETCQVVQPGPAVALDSFIKQERQDERLGTNTELKVKTESGKLMRSLLQFDLSFVPNGASVTRATLSLWVKEVRDGNATISARQVTSPWKETEVTWAARDKAAAQLWSTSGGGGDYSATALSTHNVVKDKKNYWATWTVTAAAANWAATPASNFGVLLESPVTSPRNETKFKSSDDGTASQRPKLEVCYTSGAVQVTPDNSGQGVAGQTKTYAHVVSIGNQTSAINLSAVSSKGWTTRIYRDLNSNGQLDGGEPQISQIASLGPNASASFLVQVDIPASTTISTVDYTTVTATAVVNNTSDTARDTTRVGQLIGVAPNGGSYATAGSQVFYGHMVTNNGASADQITVSAISSLALQGWTVKLWEEDRTGSGVYTIPLVNPLSLDPGESYPIVVEVGVPAGAAAGTVDRTSVRATSTNEPGVSGVAVDTTQVFVNAPPVIDGKYDQIYQTSPDTQEVCYLVDGQVFGRLASFSQPAGDSVYMVLALDKSFVDNTYGTGAIGWGTGGHDFGELVGSDKAQFYGYDANDVKVLDFQLDYITAKAGEPSGYASLGFNGGEGKINSAPTGITYTSFPEWGTSIDYSLNDTGYCTGGNCSAGGTNLLVNSPATNELYTPNATYPNWIFDVIYEFRVLKSAFGSAGYGSIEIPWVHASPNKVGNNEIPVVPVPCDNQIGDFVWHDLNHDAIQDPGEPGIDGVQLKLYADSNGDGIWDPGVDQVVATRTTSGGGNYLFQTIPAGDYFVKVVDSTVPSGMVLTTDNDPTPLISLAEGQSYLQADFGYTEAYGALEIDKTLVSVPPFYVGQELEFSIRIKNAGSTIVTTLPLEDYYDPTVLEFVSASPDPADATNDGVLNWSDLTASFGNDLGPGEMFELSVIFRALQPTKMTLAGLAAAAGLDAEPVVDGLLDADYTFLKRFLYPANDAPGNLYGFTGSSMCYYALVVDRSFNDNVYANSDVAYLLLAGWNRTHKYTDLDGSDKAVFNITYPGGSLTNLTLDYVEYNSGVAASGQTGAEGSQNPGTPPIQDAMTSMHWNFLNSGWDGGASGLITEHSPPFDYNQTSGKYWEWAMIYEFSIPKSRLGDACGDVTLASAHNSPTKFDAALATIGDEVWADADESGTRQTGEVGLPGVTVNLYQGTTLVRTTQTEPGTSGLYGFVNLPAGSYRVEVRGDTVPTDWALTTANLPFPVNNLTAGQDVTNADFGYWESGTASIGDRVWYDLNGDGAQDGGEPGINGVTINLYNGPMNLLSRKCEGLLKKTMVTSGDGAYDFTKLPAGTYCVAVDESSLPDGYTLTTDNEPLTWTLADGDQYKDADFGYQASCPDGTPNAASTRNAVDSTGTTLPDVVAIACAEINTNPGAIGDFIWYDANRDGTQDIGEPGIANVTLDLDRNGVKFASTVTDADGGYIFKGLPPGRYSVDVTDLNRKLFDSQGVAFSHIRGSQSQPDPTPDIILDAGDVYKDADFGYYATDSSGGKAVIGDTVWYDDNGDGIQQPDEPGIPGVTVVVSQNGGPQATATTDSNGHYLVQVAAGDGYTVSPDPSSPALAGLSRTTPDPAVVPPLKVGDAYLDADFGYDDGGQDLLGDIGNLVWWDTNKNGSFEGNEAPLAGVSVDLIRDSNWNGAWDAGEPIIATVTTGSSLNPAFGANGNYLFTGVPGGRAQDYYLVHVSDTNAVLIDFTRAPLGDQNADGTNKIDSYAVRLAAAGANNYTADFSYYQNDGNKVGVIGNQVWIEHDPNGIFDPLEGDFGQPGVTVLLQKQGSGGVWSEYGMTTSGASGDYSFLHLSAGEYRVSVSDLEDVLLGYNVTVLGYPQRADNRNQNQAPDGYGVSLPAAGYNLTADFGYLKPRVLGAIGDFVWYDANKDGVQSVSLATQIFDVAEPGIPNVRVALYLNMDGNNQLNPGVDRLVATTFTDADGGYLFRDLEPGVYFVDVVDAANFDKPLGQYQHSRGPQSSRDYTEPIYLARGQVYKDADFGYYWLNDGMAIVGDTVWYDYNHDGIQQPSEPGIRGVTVEIKDANGTVVGSAITDGNAVDGSDVAIGNGHYLIKVPVRSSGFTTGYTVSVNRAASSIPLAGLEPSTAESMPLPPLTAGTQYLEADFGYYDEQDALLGEVGNSVWNDRVPDGILDADGVDNITGNDDDEGALGGVSVDLIRDTNKDGVWDSDGADNSLGTKDDEPIVATVTSGTAWGSGNYLFTGVPAGNYLVHVSDTNAVLIDFTKSPLGDQSADGTNKVDPYAVTLAAGATDVRADFGYNHNTGGDVGVIGNQVWIEAQVEENGQIVQVPDGLFDPLQGDFGQPGVIVELLQGGQVIRTTTTGASGDYSFVHLPAGEYEVRVSAISTTKTDPPTPVAVLADFDVTTEWPGNTEDNTNKVQPYSVSLPTGGYNLTADFGYTRLIGQSEPAYIITKVLNGPEVVRVGQVVEFTISIQNISDKATIIQLPLRDVYDPTYLRYESADPAPLPQVVAGELNWQDLAASAAIPPNGGTVTVLVRFRTLKDTSGLQGPPVDKTTNYVYADDVWADVDGNGPLDSVKRLPDKGANAPVGANIPTGMKLAGFSAAPTADGMAVAWETAEESDIAGFNVLRKAGDGEFAVVNSELLFAQNAGANQGASYSFVDAGAPAGALTYALELVKLDGSVEVAGQVEVAR